MLSSVSTIYIVTAEINFLKQHIIELQHRFKFQIYFIEFCEGSCHLNNICITQIKSLFICNLKITFYFYRL